MVVAEFGEGFSCESGTGTCGAVDNDFGVAFGEPLFDLAFKVTAWNVYCLGECALIELFGFADVKCYVIIFDELRGCGGVNFDYLLFCRR